MFSALDKGVVDAAIGRPFVNERMGFHGAQYPTKVFHSMPVEFSVNIAAWKAPPDIKGILNSTARMDLGPVQRVAVDGARPERASGKRRQTRGSGTTRRWSDARVGDEDPGGLVEDSCRQGRSLSSRGSRMRASLMTDAGGANGV